MSWLLLFVGAAIPLHRILPWMATRLRELDSTLHKPKSRVVKAVAPIVSVWIIGLSMFKGWAAWWVVTTLGLSDWALAITLAIVVVGHSWTIFSDGDHPSPFWVLSGILLAISPALALIYVGVFIAAILIFNLPHLAVVLALMGALFEGVSSGKVPTVALPVVAGITFITLSPKLALVLDDVPPPTLWGLFIRRR